MKVLDIAQSIVNSSIPILRKYGFENIEHKLDYVDIFSKSEKEYAELSKEVTNIGKPVYKTSTGTTYKLTKPLSTKKGPLELLRVRKYYSNRKGFRGHPDYAVTDFDKAKDLLLTKDNVNLIVRPKYEMIEIWDKDFEVLIYLPSIPLSDDIKA